MFEFYDIQLFTLCPKISNLWPAVILTYLNQLGFFMITLDTNVLEK